LTTLSRHVNGNFTTDKERNKCNYVMIDPAL